MKKDTANFFNRELSWLSFNQRVLAEAFNPEVPLLERLNFLSITASNLDEFFMVRVGGLELLNAQPVKTTDPSGLTPSQQLHLISKHVQKMINQQYNCYNSHLRKALAKHGISHLDITKLNATQLSSLKDYFQQELSAIVTPMAVGAGKRFPMLNNLGLHLAVRLKPAKGRRKPRFAIIPFSKAGNRFVALPTDQTYHFVLLEEVLQLFISQLFPKQEVAETIPFRITRNADLSTKDDLASDLLSEMSQLLAARRHSQVVRLEIGQTVSPETLDFLQHNLKIENRAICKIPGPLFLGDFFSIQKYDSNKSLTYPAWPPQETAGIEEQDSIFTLLSRKNLFLHHPYDSFYPIIKLLEEAADDPQVLAIKQILYRTAKDSVIIAALKRAAANGKYVTVLVELKARFDEARNIAWAKQLEEEGLQVIYGVKGLKTHAKVCLIVRREEHGIVRYCHFGTGNYNEQTARIYTDISYLTCNDALGADASTFFNAITGYSQPKNLTKLYSAPLTIRDSLNNYIDAEIERAKQKQKARIIAKVNSLVDPDIIQRLYSASKAGVEIKLLVRGICCLKPGVKKLSENITVISIIDRLLEHSRIFYFLHGGENKYFISSADWMQRNLDKRIELMTPIEDPQGKQRLKEILQYSFKDNVKARMILADGSYEPVKGKKTLRSQEYFYKQSCYANEQEQKRKRTIFEPHRPNQKDNNL